MDDDMNPPSENDTTNNVFCFHAFMTKDGGLVYIDLTGKFPILSLQGMVHIFVMLHWDSDSILVKTMTDANETSVLSAFTEKLNS